MKCLFLAWVVVMVLAHSAAAQAPGQTEPMTAAFLEKRVPEELATEGLVLSRRNLGLQVEQLADKWLVSLYGRAGAPVAPRSSLLRDVQLTPYATGHGAGVVLGARF